MEFSKGLVKDSEGKRAGWHREKKDGMLLFVTCYRPLAYATRGTQ